MSSHYSKFDGQLIFEMAARTPAITNEGRRFNTALKLDRDSMHETDFNDAALLSFLLASTVDIAFNLQENAPDMLLLFREFWFEVAKSRAPIDEVKVGNLIIRVPGMFIEDAMKPLYEKWLLIGASTVWGEWVNCYNSVNMRFAADKTLLPFKLLTADEQADEDLKKKGKRRVKGLGT